LRAFVKGIGLISACGPALSDLREAIGSGQAPSRPEGFLVDMKRVDKAELKNLRRADKLSKLSVLAAKEALRDAGHQPAAGEDIEAGVILSTALGPHPTTFRFLDDIIQYGDKSVSPTTFSNSVHNAAASYIAAECGIKGPTLTVTQFFHSFHEGLALGLSWLEEGRLPRVIVGAVDVHGDVLAYVASRMLAPSGDGILRPFELNTQGMRKHVPGEGAVFFVLEKDTAGAYCGVESRTGFGVTPSSDGETLILIDSDGLVKDESVYPGLIREGAAVASYASCFGSLMSGSAFNAAAGALMLREGVVFPSPSAGANPHGLNVAGPGSAPRTIEALRINCSGRRGVVTLTAL